ncbi:MAG: hypothetical protein DRG30_09380 [Epsilonproteobacteria bacterium]|nr:MAG: hypothetical protein DRG30_09380 [Campylobacterota bacterium]
MQIAVNFENETIAKKVLWILEHFKNDGVEVVRLDNTDDEIINNFKIGLKEIELINQGKLTSRPVQDFLNEL